MLEPEDKEPSKSTGPKTTEGKETSSRNRITHGCRSKKTLILPDESREDYEEIERGWRAEFEPERYQEERLTDNLILNDWLLNRVQRRLIEAEMAAGEDGLPTPEQQHQVELMLRYKTTAERAFYRAWEALRGLSKDIMREKQQIRKVQSALADLQKQIAAQERPRVKAETKTAFGKGRVKVGLVGEWVDGGRSIGALAPSMETKPNLGLSP